MREKVEGGCRKVANDSRRCGILHFLSEESDKYGMLVVCPSAVRGRRFHPMDAVRDGIQRSGGRIDEESVDLRYV